MSPDPSAQKQETTMRHITEIKGGSRSLSSPLQPCSQYRSLEMKSHPSDAKHHECCNPNNGGWGSGDFCRLIVGHCQQQQQQVILSSFAAVSYASILVKRNQWHLQRRHRRWLRKTPSQAPQKLVQKETNNRRQKKMQKRSITICTQYI